MKIKKPKKDDKKINSYCTSEEADDFAGQSADEAHVKLREAIDLLKLTGWLDQFVDKEDQARAERLAGGRIINSRN
jgi:hypothetical protein